MDIRQVTDDYAVSAQIAADDISGDQGGGLPQHHLQPA